MPQDLTRSEIMLRTALEDLLHAMGDLQHWRPELLDGLTQGQLRILAQASVNADLALKIVKGAADEPRAEQAPPH